MNQPIMCTPKEIVDTLLAICGAVITISAVFTIVLKAIQKVKEPDKKQNERIAALEGRVDEHDVRFNKVEDRLRLGNKRFEADAARQDSMETGLAISVSVIIKTLQALTKHALDGSNTEDLKEAQKELDEYLTDNLVKRKTPWKQSGGV
ncbi:MAG: hypothetical protein IJJ13_00465 [Lachnospiraceae bacterium]|nr:hypothetical protein [Lachnospiraceae bacterium]